MVHLSEFQLFVKLHQNQLISSGVPPHFWETLHLKLISETFDSGNTFNLIKIYDEEEEENSICQLQIKVENGIRSEDSEHIYLVDHAFTFSLEYAKQLLSMDKIRERVASIMGLNQNLDKIILTDKIFEDMWKYVNHYSIGNAKTVEERMPVWYIMDEVGSGIHHSDDPNFRMVPFQYISKDYTYSLIFPIKDVDFASVVTRDFVEGITGNERDAALLPWIPKSFKEQSYAHVNPSPDYFLSGHIKESLPILTNLSKLNVKKSLYKVYTQYEYVQKYLNDPNFVFVSTEDEADILWYTEHFKKFEDLSSLPNKYVNQFPFEYVILIKDVLAITCRRKSPKTCLNLETLPKWLPVTYNLKTEIPEFVSYYQNRDEHGLDNHWIIKPFNLARGLDTHITKNLNYIMRLPSTGPKIAQKYIENPILFSRPEIGKVKFDIRYVLLLKSVNPLEAYAYTNFFLRFANKPFALNNFDVYEQHFTVMNYTEAADLKHMLCSEFKLQWEEQYPNYPWENIEQSIMSMLKEMFECAILEPPPCGISESPQSRALYAADIMLEWDQQEIQPKLLEVNWTPDCKRACEYYPEFYNDIFKLLFLDVENSIFYKL